MRRGEGASHRGAGSWLSSLLRARKHTQCIALYIYTHTMYSSVLATHTHTHTHTHTRAHTNTHRDRHNHTTETRLSLNREGPRDCSRLSSQPLLKHAKGVANDHGTHTHTHCTAPAMAAHLSSLEEDDESSSSRDQKYDHTEPIRSTSRSCWIACSFVNCGRVLLECSYYVMNL